MGPEGVVTKRVRASKLGAAAEVAAAAAALAHGVHVGQGGAFGMGQGLGEVSVDYAEIEEIRRDGKVRRVRRDGTGA
jgi:hypothetical protein